MRKQAYNLADPDVYSAHSAFVMHIANNIVLAPQRRKFIVDDNNRDVLRFLLYYFNNCPLQRRSFPVVATNCTRASSYRAVSVWARRSSCKSSASISSAPTTLVSSGTCRSRRWSITTPFTTTSTVSPTTRRSAVVSSATHRTCASTTSAYKTALSSAWTQVSSPMSSCTLATRFGRSTASLPTSPPTSTTKNFKSGSSAMTVSVVSLTVSKLTT